MNAKCLNGWMVLGTKCKLILSYLNNLPSEGQLLLRHAPLTGAHQEGQHPLSHPHGHVLQGHQEFPLL